MRKFLSFVMCAVLTAALIISQTGCSEKTEKVEKTSYYMDTICKITVYDMEDMSEEKAGAAIDEAFALSLIHISSGLSPHRPAAAGSP